MPLKFDLRTPPQLSKNDKFLDFLILIKNDQMLKEFNGMITLSNKDISLEERFILVSVEPEDRFVEVRKYLLREYYNNIGD